VTRDGCEVFGLKAMPSRPIRVVELSLLANLRNFDNDRSAHAFEMVFAGRNRQPIRSAGAACQGCGGQGCRG
jgi:hypothetical protein